MDDLVAACRDLRLLTTFWFFATIAAGIVAVHFGCLYAFGVRLRLPRIRASMKRLAGNRDEWKAKALRSEMERSEERTKAKASDALLRSKMETIGLEAQKELDRVDAIRRKTEDRLIFQNAEIEQMRADLAEERDVSQSLRDFLAAVHSVEALANQPEPGESWVGEDSAAALGAATK